MWRILSLPSHIDDCYRFIVAVFLTDMMLAIWLPVSIGTGDDCHGSSLLSLTNTPYIYLPIIEVLNGTSIAKFAASLNQTRTLKVPNCTTKRKAPSSKIGSFVAVRRHGNYCIFIFVSHFLLQNASLTKLRPAPVSSGNVCGWRCWVLTPSFAAMLYVDFRQSDILVSDTWKRLSSANIYGIDLWNVGKRFYFCGGFISFGNKDVSYLVVHKALALVAWWDLVWEGFTCFTSPVSFSDWISPSGGIGFSNVTNAVIPLNIDRVTPIRDAWTRCAILFGFPSMGSSPVKISFCASLSL